MTNEQGTAERPSTTWYSIWFTRALWLIYIGSIVLSSEVLLSFAIQYLNGSSNHPWNQGLPSSNDFVWYFQACQIIIGAATVFVGTVAAFVTACAALVTQIKKLRKALSPTPARAMRKTKSSASPARTED